MPLCMMQMARGTVLGSWLQGNWPLLPLCMDRENDGDPGHRMRREIKNERAIKRAKRSKKCLIQEKLPDNFP